MSDVNTFIETVGHDVSTITAPRIEALADTFHAKSVSDYGPKISAFAGELVKQIIADQSSTVRDFATSLIQDLCARYRPDLTGDLRTTIVPHGIQVTGNNVKLDLKRRDTGAVIASLDIPVNLTIAVSDIAVTLENTTIKLDVVK